MVKKKNNLDEMQEQELLKIEHNGCWMAFWLLPVTMIVQSIVYREMVFRMLAGEWIVFMILALYLAFACARRGIWDRRIPMTTKANLVISIIAAAAVGGFNAIIVMKNYQKPIGALAASVITTALTFAVCFAALTLMLKKTQKRKMEIEAEPSDADEL